MCVCVCVCGGRGGAGRVVVVVVWGVGGGGWRRREVCCDVRGAAFASMSYGNLLETGHGDDGNNANRLALCALDYGKLCMPDAGGRKDPERRTGMYYSYAYRRKNVCRAVPYVYVVGPGNRAARELRRPLSLLPARVRTETSTDTR